MPRKIPRQAVNVHLVTNNTSNITRKDILEWISSVCNVELKRVEDLANGSIYCRIMEKIFPGSIQLNRVRTNTKFDSDALANYKLLFYAFREHEVKKDIPMHNLLKGRFLDNFRFAQWFKLFYEANKSERAGKKHPSIVYDEERQPGLDFHHPRRSKSVTAREVSFVCPESPAPEEPLHRRPPSGPGTISSYYRSAARTEESMNHQGYHEINANPVSDLNVSRTVLGETEKPPGHEEDLYVEPSDPSDAEIYEFPSPVKKDPLLAGDSVNGITEQHISAYREQTKHGKCVESESLDDENLDTAGHYDNPKAVSPSPYPKRRNGSGRRHGTPGVQLPPPSPSPSNAHICGPHRSNRRTGAATPSNQNQQYANLLASGDRPNTCASNQVASDTEALLSGRTSVSINSGHRLASDGSFQNYSAASETSSQRSRSCSTGAHNSAVVSSTKMDSQHAYAEKPPNASTHSQKRSSASRITKSKVAKDKQKLGTGECVEEKQQKQQRKEPVCEGEPLTLTNYPSNSNEYVDPELMTESMLHRELAMLRFETMGQRKSLFYCQKEAQFYFKKLRQIEDLCLRLNDMKEKPQDGILDAIFGILYETEEGFASPCEAEACV